MYTIRPNLLFTFILSLSLLGVNALARQKGAAPSSSRVVQSIQLVQKTTLVQIDPLQARRQSLAKKGPGPLTYAQVEEVLLSPANSGTWEVLPNGDRLWRLRMEAPGATDLNFGFSRYHLPAGATLHICSESHTYYQGPYTAADNAEHGAFWSPVIPGDKAVLELLVPVTAKFEPEVILTDVGKGFLDLFKVNQVPLKQGACNNDVICPEGDPWRDQIRAVGGYSFGGSVFCTGTLIMDAAGSFRNWFITASHCGVSPVQAASVVVYWNFESPVCGQLGGGSLNDSQSGAILRAEDVGVDVLLLELTEDPDSAFNVFYAGWDRTGVAPNSAVGIHHPGGDEKAISFEDNKVLTGGACGSGTHWRINSWDDGTTESGSSGSGLFHGATKRLIGTLTGGSASCINTSGYDCYGQFSVAWDNGGTPATQLKNWLDPDNTGAMTVDGYNGVQLDKPVWINPNIPTTWMTNAPVPLVWSLMSGMTGLVTEVEITDKHSGDNVLFIDDLEAGAGNWQTSNGTGSTLWVVTTLQSFSPTHSWYANNVGIVSDQYLTLDSMVLGPGPQLRFKHSYNTENGFDGGVVEISTNGMNGTYVDLETKFLTNGYTIGISTDYDNPIGGRLAFTGNSGGYIESRIDLSDFSGATAHIRFRFGSDTTQSAIGWYVDDVSLVETPVWTPIVETIPDATNYWWTTLSALGTNYGLRIRNSLFGYRDSPWCVSDRTILAEDADQDADTLPTSWEIQYGLDSNEDGSLGETGAGLMDGPHGRLGNVDGDDYVNWQEYVADTDPTNGASYFYLSAFPDASGNTIEFPASANRVYDMAYGSLTSVWVAVVTNVPGAAPMHSITHNPTNKNGAYHIRVRLPD